MVRDEGQPRKSFTETSLKELAESIKKHGGFAADCSDEKR